MRLNRRSLVTFLSLACSPPFCYYEELFLLFSSERKSLLWQTVRAREASLQVLVGRQVRARLDSLAIHPREIICQVGIQHCEKEGELLKGDGALSLIEVTSTQVLRLAVGVG